MTLVHWSANFKGVARPNMKGPAVETKLVAKAVFFPKEEWPEDMRLSLLCHLITPHTLFLKENNGYPLIQFWSS
jgi:hypothetical protein